MIAWSRAEGPSFLLPFLRPSLCVGFDLNRILLLTPVVTPTDCFGFDLNRGLAVNLDFLAAMPDEMLMLEPRQLNEEQW